MLQGYNAAGQQRLVRPFLLDLHGLSTSAARLALLKVEFGTTFNGPCQSLRHGDIAGNHWLSEHVCIWLTLLPSRRG